MARRLRPLIVALRPVWLVLRYVWALPATMVGLTLLGIALCTGATARLVDGVVEVAGGHIARVISSLPRSRRFVAITFGHVVFGIDHAILRRVRSHEYVHVRQYERWGILFFLIYFASSVIQLFRGRDPYLDNCFEREAYACAPEALIRVAPDRKEHP